MDPFEPKMAHTRHLLVDRQPCDFGRLLCAIFAGYVFDIKEDLNNAKIRSEIMEQRA